MTGYCKILYKMHKPLGKAW